MLRPGASTLKPEREGGGEDHRGETVGAGLSADKRCHDVVTTRVTQPASGRDIVTRFAQLRWGRLDNVRPDLGHVSGLVLAVGR